MIDLRSDTVTRPTEEMRRAMAKAPVGDDVYGEDPTVNRLEEIAADIMGFESALFTASGTQANFTALLAHCGRGDEYIVGQQAHTYLYEGGGAAVFGGIQPQPLDFQPDGTLDLSKAEEKIKPDDFHFARTKLLCLENTHNGAALPLEYLAEASSFAKDRGLGIHLDGARVFNASVKQGVDVKEITKHFDSSTACLSKGLGAPVGSVLCGDRELIKAARRWRKVAGGGMRQAGILAEAGIIAMTSHVQRLAEDHENALVLARGLSEVEELSVDLSRLQTNIFFVETREDISIALEEYLKSRGILIFSGASMRMVTHMDVSREDVLKVVSEVKQFFKNR